MTTLKQLNDKSGNAIQPKVPDKAGYLNTKTSKTTGTTYTASEDGYIFTDGLSASGSDINCTMNGQSYRVAAGAQDNIAGSGTNVHPGSGLLLPIKKGTTYKSEGGESGTTKLYFISLKTGTS